MVARTLGGAGAVDGALFGGERLHEPRNELVEASLTNATDHRTERSCRRRPHLGHRVQQRLLQPGYHRRQVRRQVLHTDRPTDHASANYCSTQTPLLEFLKTEIERTNKHTFNGLFPGLPG